MHETVQCTGTSAAAPEDVWRMLSGFDLGWHPMVAWCETRREARGGLLRRFAATDTPDVIMSERLTYISQSDRLLTYEIVSGIAGALRYTARVQVDAAGASGGSSITWQAEIAATSPVRAAEIAAGTRAIFDAGIAALATPPPAAPPARHAAKPAQRATRQIDGAPRLALSIAPDRLGHTGTLCLLLHGIGGNRSNWDRQVSVLGGQIPTAAMDLRGYGQSDPGGAQTAIDDYCADILKVMSDFKARKLVLGGLSYGAWVSASFALRYPDHIAGLILLGGCTGMTEASQPERDAFRTAREVPLDAGQTPADFAPSVVDAITGPEASPDVRQKLLSSMAAISRDTYRDALTCFCNPTDTLDLSRASFPVLLMTGAHDRLAPPEEIRRISHRFADAGAPFVRFEEIGGAGHVCNLEQPDAVDAILAEFVQPFASKTQTGAKAARKSEKRGRILASALREFSSKGYSGASMQAIADGAGVSKPTLYQYIGQKDDLFGAVIEQGRSTILAPITAAAGDDLVAVLWAFSWSYADYVLHPDNLSVARLVIAEAERAPELAQRFHDTGPARVLDAIAEYLVAQRAAGRLEFDDAHLAAGDLWSLILSEPRNLALHFPQQSATPGDVRRHICNGLSVFLRAYAVDRARALDRLSDLVSGDRP